VFRHYVFGKVKTRDISIANAIAFACRAGSAWYYVLSSQNIWSARGFEVIGLSVFLGHLQFIPSLPSYPF
jgi:hypothetical protein